MGLVVTSGEQQYMAGYDAAQAICVQTGSTEAARRWLELESHRHETAYVAGYEWALWDYEDANGLQQTAPPSRSAG